MNHTREEWIDILGQIQNYSKLTVKNRGKIRSLERRLTVSRLLLISPIIIFITMGPLYILQLIETKNVPGISFLFTNVLPVIIPGFYYIYGVVYFSLIILLIYGLLSIGRKKSLLYKIGFFQRLNNKIESKYRPTSNKFRNQNHRMKNSKAATLVPADYRSPDAIKQMRQYLINRRAENLSEAIEVYELELHRERELYEATNSMRIAEEISEEQQIKRELEQLRK